MFLLMPVFALLTRVAWRRAGRRYPAHLYVSLHLHAALFGASLVSWIAIGFGPVPAAPLFTALLLAYLGWHGVTALRRVFRDSWPRTIVKTVATAFVYVGCLLAVSLVLFAYAISRM